VVGIDFTGRMLARAGPRWRATAPGRRIHLARADALRLPFPDGSFDLAMSAFLARNLPRLPEALLEARRVLRPGGTLLILELTQPPSPGVRRFATRYFDTMIPFVGEMFHSGGPSRYLAESFRFLPARPEMLALLRASGFAPVTAAPQSFGIVTTYFGEVPVPSR
jgi:demethylmenaquinone methyltransferase / 2-methoxy-6-polyprenyl-1,4-benzoquinol methylase